MRNVPLSKQVLYRLICTMSILYFSSACLILLCVIGLSIVNSCVCLFLFELAKPASFQGQLRALSRIYIYVAPQSGHIVRLDFKSSLSHLNILYAMCMYESVDGIERLYSHLNGEELCTLHARMYIGHEGLHRASRSSGHFGREGERHCECRHVCACTECSSHWLTVSIAAQVIEDHERRNRISSWSNRRSRRLVLTHVQS